MVATDTPLADRLTDVIGLVSHDTRVAILVALATRQREAPRDPWLRFSELRKAVGHDDPGNFNYHLQRLVDSLVKADEDGYRLSLIGQRLVGLLVSGRIDPGREPEIDEGDAPCLLCDASGTAEYTDGALRVSCPDGHRFVANVGPDVVAGRSLAAALELGLTRVRFEMRLAVDGVCPLCDGSMEAGLESRRGDSSAPQPVMFTASCTRCGLFLQNTVDGCVLDHPAVIRFFADHGVDLRWDTHTVATDHIADVTLETQAPPEATVRFAIEDARLAVRVDADGRVLATDRDDSIGS